MFSILPFITLIFLYSICKIFYHEWRLSIVSATVIWGLIILLVTEILSFLNLIKFEFISTTWLLLDISLAIIYFKLFNKTLVDIKPNLNSQLPKLLPGVAFLVALIGLIGFVAPPTPK